MLTGKLYIIVQRYLEGGKVTVNILCMKWGKAYNADYVNKLYNMVRRNLSLPFVFTCFTDDREGLDLGINVLPLPEIRVPKEYDYSPWRKLSMFRSDLGGLSGKALFLDLDIVILDKLDCFFEYTKNFAIIENWSQLGRGIGNSSVYCFEIGKHSYLYELYAEDPLDACQSFDNEQIFLSKHIKGRLEFWPETWCRSFKRHSIPRGLAAWFCTPRVPEGCKILVFHGHPKPHEAIEGRWPGKLLKHVRKTPWIRNYWY